MMRGSSDDAELERLRTENRHLRDQLADRVSTEAQGESGAIAKDPSVRDVEALEQQIRLGDTVLSSIKDYVFICDLQGRITYANRARLQLWQRNLGDVLGKTFSQLGYQEALAARVQGQIETVVATRESLHAEAAYQSVDGKTGYYDYILAPVFGKDGQVEAVVGSTRDISERHREQTEKEALLRTLQVERERLNSLFLQAPAFIAVLRGPDHIFELTNPPYDQLVGKRNLIGKPVRKAFPDVEGQGFFEMLDVVYRTGQPFVGKQMRIRFQEEPNAAVRERYLDFVYQPLVEADGSISGIFAHGVDVTEHKHAEEALRASKELFRTTLHSIGDAVIATDISGHVTFLNSVAERLTGWNTPDAVGKDAGQIFHIVNEQTREEVFSPITRVLLENRVVGLANHTLLLARDGHEYPIEDSGAPIRDEAGNLLGVVLVFRDVTENRRKEQAVQQSQTRTQLVIETALDAVVEIGEDDRISGWNAQAEQMFGWSREEAIGQTLAETIIPVPYRQAHLQGLQRYLETGQGPILNQRIEITALHREGDEFAVDLAISPIQTAGKTTFSAFIRNLTSQKQAEQTRAHLAAIVHSSDDAIISKDLTGIVTSWNPAAERIYGYTAQEILGKSKAILIPADMPEELPTILRKIKAGERIEHYETARVRKDGSRIQISISVSPVRNAGGQIIGASTIARDISERLQHLQEIKALNVRLKRSIQETHHRVKNNLQVISALADIQMEEGHLMVPITALARIGQHTRSLAAVHDLLTQEAKTDAHTDNISTRATLDRLVPLLQATLGGHRITYKVDDFHLPVQEGASLALLISELVSNAVKHGRTDIELSLTRLKDVALLEVCDDGAGFPSDFDWRTAANTGMALIDSVGRHDLHGTITYQNQPHGGAHVVVVFPIPFP